MTYTSCSNKPSAYGVRGGSSKTDQATCQCAVASLTLHRTDTIIKSQLATSQLPVINSHDLTVDEQLLLRSIREIANCYHLAMTSHRDDVIMTSLEVILLAVW